MEEVIIDNNNVEEGKENLLGNLIQEKRKALGMTQRELSQKTGLPQSLLSEIETGKTISTCKTIRKIQKVLDLDGQSLYDIWRKAMEEAIIDNNNVEEGKENLLGNLIQEKRKALGMTQRELSQKTGLVERLLSEIETGKTISTYKTIRKIQKVLDLDGQVLSDILFGKE